MSDILQECRHIFWDWNGTLLNDVGIAVEAMNSMLKRRKMPVMNEDRYRDIFTFPVKDYYSLLGFDFEAESFEKLSTEFIGEFNSRINRFRLHDGVPEVLNTFKRSGVGQSILSASQERELNQAVNKMDIRDYFISVAGLNDHYAKSKVKRGEELLCELGLEPREVLLLGDTVHDYDVANAIGCRCMLIGNGHQSCRRIADCNAPVIKSVSELIGFIKGEAIA